MTFKIEKGESVLLLGPNGAGKTTLLRCLLGLLDFTGKVVINGLDVKREGVRVRRLVGYVPQASSLPRDYTLKQVVTLHSRLHGVSVDPQEVLRLVELEDYANFKVGELSGGMRQRLALALAVSHDPEILLLDEPTANLDQEGRDIFLRLFSEWRTEGKTVMVSSHRLVEVLPLTDRVLVLNGGRLVYDSSALKLLERVRRVKVAVRTDKWPSLHVKSGRIVSMNHGWALIESSIGEAAGLITELARLGLIMIMYEPGVDEILKELGVSTEE